MNSPFELFTSLQRNDTTGRRGLDDAEAYDVLRSLLGEYEVEGGVPSNVPFSRAQHDGLQQKISGLQIMLSDKLDASEAEVKAADSEAKMFAEVTSNVVDNLRFEKKKKEESYYDIVRQSNETGEKARAQQRRLAGIVAETFGPEEGTSNGFDSATAKGFFSLQQPYYRKLKGGSELMRSSEDVHPVDDLRFLFGLLFTTLDDMPACRQFITWLDGQAELFNHFTARNIATHHITVGHLVHEAFNTKFTWTGGNESTIGFFTDGNWDSPVSRAVRCKAIEAMENIFYLLMYRGSPTSNMDSDLFMLLLGSCGSDLDQAQYGKIEFEVIHRRSLAAKTLSLQTTNGHVISPIVVDREQLKCLREMERNLNEPHHDWQDLKLTEALKQAELTDALKKAADKVTGASSNAMDLSEEESGDGFGDGFDQFLLDDFERCAAASNATNEDDRLENALSSQIDPRNDNVVSRTFELSSKCAFRLQVRLDETNPTMLLSSAKNVRIMSKRHFLFAPTKHQNDNGEEIIS